MPHQGKIGRSIEMNNEFMVMDEEELLDIQKKLEFKKENISKLSVDYLDEIYEKTKKDEI